jgi:hypothetical protein
MKSWQLRLGVVLVLLSALTYLAHYLIFDDLHHILIFLVGDLAFVFIEVLLVTLIIHSLLERRERANLIAKLSTVIGAFFSELGRPMIVLLARKWEGQNGLGVDLRINNSWTEDDYKRAVDGISEKRITFKLDAKGLTELKVLLTERRSFLLGMMENPNLLEHERFTEMLLALFHIQEELTFRGDLDQLPRSDIAHLNKDVDRAFALIIREWVLHMRHLQINYSYLFSLATRTNPLDPFAETIVKE